MRLPLLISLNFMLSALMISYIGWFKQDEASLKALNSTYIQNIEKLEKILHINQWLESAVIPNIKEKLCEAEEADKSLIEFYDLNKGAYNLYINKYIYEGKDTKNMELSYEISTHDKTKLIEFLMLRQENRFFQFKELRIDNDRVVGIIEVAQSCKKASHVSH
jgi:hypothetical protein